MRIRGEGSVPSEIMFVGEGPGPEEDRVGRPFVGKAGKELNRFLDGDSLPLREDVFVDNLYRQYGGKKYVYTAEDLARDEPELIRNIKAVQPKIIVPLGRHSTRWFMGDVDMDDCQGIPWIVTPEKVGREVVVLPIVHPAAGFHNPEMSPYVVDGFFQLSRFLNGEVEARVMFDDPYPNPVYEEVTDATHLRVVLRAVCRGTRVHVDTEGTPGHPWSLQFSFQLGTGYLIRAAHRDLLRLFAAHIRGVGAIIVYHNSLHDLSINRALGIADLLADVQFDDTMVMAYLLQIVPQGLKPLGLRFANMRMRSYMDLLGGKQNQLALDYAVGLFDIEQFDWEARCEDAFWTEIDKGRNIRVHPKVPKTPLHKAAERILRSKKPYKLWNDQIEDTRVAGYNRMGPMPEATLNHVPAGDAIEYGCRDADCTGRVRPELERRLDALELRPVYDLEIATYPLIDQMQKVGIRPDLPYFKKFSAELQDEIDIIQYRLEQWTGREDFNANSGDQVAEYLFDELGLEPLKMTESGRGSTNDKILGGLEHEHGNSFPVIGDIREYREVYKLKNTFVDRLPDFVRYWPYDDRIHSTFRTTRVITGRLSASDPNILALPKRGKFAKAFRRGFIADPGHIFGSWDLSQIELRILAHLSQDPLMLAIYRGEKRNTDGSLIDLHAQLAERIFGVKPADQDKSKHRLPAKAINFGIPMGMTNIGLTIELRKNGVMVTEDDAQRWLDETFALYKAVPNYMDQMRAEARRNGYIRCLSGRIRYIGGIRSSNERVRAEAERFAFSTPIQEGAQFVMKTAGAYIWKNIIQRRQKMGQWIEPIVQIHDDMVLELQSEQLAREVHPEMVYAMTKVFQELSVPIETSGDLGPNWADMVEIVA